MQDRDTRAPVFRTPSGGAPDVFAPARSPIPPAVADGEANVFAAPPSELRVAQAVDAAAIMASVGEAPYLWDIASDALSWGAEAGCILGVTQADTIATGRGFAKLLDAGTKASRFDAVMNSERRDEGNGVPYQLQYALRTGAAGTPLWVEDTGLWFAGDGGKPARAQGVVRVINERHAQEERLAFLSRFDSLTGEMNRWRLAEVLETTVEETAKQRGSCGFMLAAIDNLALLNEAYGFEVADEVIGAVAKRLRAKMRGGDEIGRFSGNKFGIVLHNCALEDMERAAERLLAGVRDDVIRTAAGPVAATVTIGGVTAPRHARTVAEVLARAQETLERAKVKRRGSFQVYRPNVERDALRKENVRSADEIVAALNERRILLAFEPAVNAATRQPAFYECLLRIKRSDGALLKAAEIVPVAERLGLIRLLDHRVLELLVSEMAAVPDLQASVNVSPASTVDPDWWSALDALLRANSGVGERLIVEITEMAAIQDVEDTRGFVSRVKDRGCRIAIDDFGAGYTSFRNLRKLGVDMLKIDGAFVRNVAKSEDDRAFVRTLIDLARRLGLKTVAEWVQDEHGAQMLEAWGCDHLQGALIGLASVERPWGAVTPVDRRKSARP